MGMVIGEPDSGSVWAFAESESRYRIWAEAEIKRQKQKGESMATQKTVENWDFGRDQPLGKTKAEATIRKQMEEESRKNPSITDIEQLRDRIFDKWDREKEERMKNQEFNNISRPAHYNSNPSGLECIIVAEKMDFCLGNAWKYLFRCELKGAVLDDLEKALWYVNRSQVFMVSGEGVPDAETVLNALQHMPANLALALSAIYQMAFSHSSIFDDAKAKAVAHIQREIDRVKARYEKNGN